MDKKDMDFETAMSKLMEMSERIQQPDVSLQESIRCYEEGMEYYKMCTEVLDNAKQKIETEEIPE